MSLPKSVECDCEVVDDPEMVCPEHQERLIKALAIAVKALEKISKEGCTAVSIRGEWRDVLCVQTAKDTLKRISELGGKRA